MVKRALWCSGSNRVKALLALALAATVVVAGCAGDPDGSLPEEVGGRDSVAPALVVASTYTGVPFEMKTGMEPEGFAIDLLARVGDELGTSPTFGDPVHDESALPDIEPGTVEDVAASVAAHEATVGLSSIRLSDDLPEGVVATDSYLALDLAVVVRADSSIEGVEAIGVGPVAVQGRGSAAAWTAESMPEAELVTYDDPNDALSALVSGNVVACVVDEPVVQRFRKVKAPGRLAVVETVTTGDGFVMVVAEDNGALATAINEALAALKADGTYDELIETWFGEPSQRGDAGPYTAMPDGPGDMVFQNG